MVTGGMVVMRAVDRLGTFGRQALGTLFMFHRAVMQGMLLRSTSGLHDGRQPLQGQRCHQEAQQEGPESAGHLSLFVCLSQASSF